MNRPLIEWQVCGACNYDCSYCIQSRKHRQGIPSPDETERFVDFFTSLPRPFEIKMSGGEPFAHPGLLTAIIPGLVRRSAHTLSLLTNLSAGREALAEFTALTRGRLGIVSASLHLESVTVEAFLASALYLRSRMDSSSRLVINAVLVPGRLEGIEAAAVAIRSAGLKFFPQWMKTKSGRVEYTAAEQQIVRRLTGESPTPREANLVPSYRGCSCRAGLDYFVVARDGTAWSCRSARRQGEGYLGNVLDGSVRLFDEVRTCRYDLCPCTTPANRGMISPPAVDGRERG